MRPLVRALALCVLVFATLVGPARSASAPAIIAFYPSSGALCPTWGFTKPPAQVTSYPAGVRTAAYYLEWAGATPANYFQVKNYRNGSLFFAASLHPFPMSSNAIMAGCGPSAQAFPNGAYHIDLLVDGATVRSVGFKVGGAYRAVQPARPASPTFAALYTVDPKDALAWDHASPLPRRNQFPAATRRISLYLEYAGARPGATLVSGLIFPISGPPIVARFGPFPLPLMVGSHVITLTLPSALKSGVYILEVLNTPMSSQAKFTVK